MGSVRIIIAHRIDQVENLWAVKPSNNKTPSRISNTVSVIGGFNPYPDLHCGTRLERLPGRPPAGLECRALPGHGPDYQDGA